MGKNVVEANRTHKYTMCKVYFAKPLDEALLPQIFHPNLRTGTNCMYNVEEGQRFPAHRIIMIAQKSRI